MAIDREELNRIDDPNGNDSITESPLHLETICLCRQFGQGSNGANR